MATNEQRDNNVIYSIPSRVMRHNGPEAMPRNAVLGGTTGGPNNYGQGRATPVMGAYSQDQLMGYVAPRGTSQQRYTTTRLPGDR